MSRFLGFICSLCGETYGPTDVQYTCPKDQGNLDVVLDIAGIRRRYEFQDILNTNEPSMWRYLPLLPIYDPGECDTPLSAAGHTPMYFPTRLADELGLQELYVKDESRNPTASFKDRASALVVARARQIEAPVIVTASTGNAGAALAGMAASSGHQAVIFAPRTAPAAKIAQLLVYGARVILVDGTYDDAFDLTIQASQEFGWYCRNTGYNPFTAEGKKTGALEIWEYFARQHASRRWDSPLNIFVSVGDGNIISGLHKGLKDLEALGWLAAVGMPMPRLVGVQAAGSAAIANAFLNNTEKIIPVQAHTLADSISVDLPRDGVRAVRAAKETGGNYLIVSDEEILKAIPALGKVGIFAEPAGATAYAGLVQAVQSGLIGEKDPCVVVNTGSGLKDVKAAMQSVVPAPIIEPNLDAVKKVFK